MKWLAITEQDGLISVDENKQHNSSCIHKQPKGHCVRGAGTTDLRSVDVVSRVKHSYQCAVPPRQLEQSSRQGVEVYTGRIRLEVRSEHLQKNRQDLRPPRGGPVCVQMNTPVPSLLQLAARSLHRGNRRIPPGLVSTEGVCQPPPLEPNIQSSDKDSGTET